ncbi:alpha/beta fold hydrolase [Propionibacteriaceae bacterium Y2011]
MPQVTLPQGEIAYTDSGDGPVVVFLHGPLMDAGVWQPVIRLLAPHVRCLAPTLPLGAHRIPVNGGRDHSLAFFGDLVLDFLQALDVEDATVVGNDHAAVLAVAVRHGPRVGRLVITSCEAYDNYPPGAGGRALATLSRIPGGLALLAQLARSAPLRRRLLADMALHGIDDELSAGWFAPLRREEIRDDLRAYTRPDRRHEMHRICADLGSVDVPCLVVWTPEDRLQDPTHGARLAHDIPDAELVEIADSSTLIMLDQPEQLAAAIRSFLGRVLS